MPKESFISEITGITDGDGVGTFDGEDLRGAGKTVYQAVGVKRNTDEQFEYEIIAVKNTKEITIFETYNYFGTNYRDGPNNIHLGNIDKFRIKVYNADASTSLTFFLFGYHY